MGGNVLYSASSISTSCHPAEKVEITVWVGTVIVGRTYLVFPTEKTLFVDVRWQPGEGTVLNTITKKICISHILKHFKSCMGEPVYIRGAFGDRSEIVLQHGKKEFKKCKKCGAQMQGEMSDTYANGQCQN